MSFWSGYRLKNEGKLLNICTNIKVDCSALVLSLGDECFITPNFNQENGERKILEKQKEEDIFGFNVKRQGGEVIIPPGQFCFLLTEEKINIPESTMGFISLKSKFKWRGLINVSGFHVDPGFKGRLVYSVYNAGPSKIHLSRGEDIFLLWISDLKNSDTIISTDDNDLYNKFSKKYNDNKLPLSSIPQDIINITDRPMHSLQNLSEKVDKLEGEIKFLFRLAGAAVAVLTLLTGIITFYYKVIAVQG